MFVYHDMFFISHSMNQETILTGKQLSFCFLMSSNRNILQYHSFLSLLLYHWNFVHDDHSLTPIVNTFWIMWKKWTTLEQNANEKRRAGRNESGLSAHLKWWTNDALFSGLWQPRAFTHPRHDHYFITYTHVMTWKQSSDTESGQADDVMEDLPALSPEQCTLLADAVRTNTDIAEGMENLNLSGLRS